MVSTSGNSGIVGRRQADVWVVGREAASLAWQSLWQLPPGGGSGLASQQVARHSTGPSHEQPPPSV